MLWTTRPGLWIAYRAPVRTGLFLGIFANRADAGDVDPAAALIEKTRRAYDDGFASVWLPQVFDVDALTMLAVVGREVPDIELGTAVIATYPRHPMVLAQQALTVQALTRGRLALGIGLSHRIVIEGMFGMSFDKPARHMREYLSVLLPLLHGEPAAFTGETLSGNGTLQVPGASPVPVLLAALAPRMLHLAGAVADGTITWMTGPQTLGDHIVPSIRRAAESAGRSEPRIVCALPVAVTDEPDRLRQRASKIFAIYDGLPSYKAMLDKEGAGGPADVAIVGDEATVLAQLEELDEQGATDFVAVEFASGEERDRTRALLKTLL
jgi:5,10-methylenetetrahydromethanopterin reductase